jgi:hypothetical protein
MALARSGSTWGRQCVSSHPRRISSMIAHGFSERGLSLVTTTTSAAAAARPIRGRFERSRSPPAPKTQITRPDVISRTAAIERVSASSVCA